MRTRLPGDEPASSVGLGILKTVLRLAGGETLADAIGDLTGLGRTTVEGLARRALEATGPQRVNEFRSLSDADREWVERVLVSSYCRLASFADATIARESLVGSESLAALVFGAGMEASDREELERAAYDVRSYFQLVSRSMATVVSQWYRSDQRASQVAVVAAVGAVLETVRDVLARMDNLERGESTQTDGLASESLGRLLRKELEELNRAPDYYPEVFDNVVLAASLHVAELDDRDFKRFEGRGLYWEGQLYGERLTLALDAMRPSELTVLLGNPGSGKSTIAKALVASEIRKGRTALYCRLEDFSRVCSNMPDEPGVAALIAAAQAAGTRIDTVASRRILGDWVSDRHPLIVLDGLDELATASDYAVARRAAAGLSEAGHPVLVTSRVAGYTVPWKGVSRHLAIWPLDDEARDNFSEMWFASTGDDIARNRFAAVTVGGSLDEVLDSPLTLGFVCRLAHYGDIPITTGAIFSRFIDHFLRAPWRDPAVQRISASQIGQLKKAAESVAWAMAGYGTRDDSVWLDIAELDVIDRVARDQAAYDAYATGLLIPHGPVEPLGGTQQRARWLHRALHENFVAQRIVKLVETDDARWRDLVFRTSFSAAWRGSLVQAFMLLGEGTGIKAVLRYFEEQVQAGDSPLGHLAGILTDVGVHSSSAEDRRRTALVLIAAEEWYRAAYVDPRTTLPELRDYIRSGKRPRDEQVWVRLYQANPPGSDDLLIEAAEAGCGTPEGELATAARWIRLGRASQPLRQRIITELCSTHDWPITWFLRPLEEPARSDAIAALASLLREPDPRSRISLRRAQWIWQAIVGRESSQREVPADPDLLAAVLLGRKVDNMDRDLSDLRHLITMPLSDEDMLIAIALRRQGFAIAARNRDSLAAADVLYDLWEVDDAGGPEQRLHLTPLSPHLALAVILQYVEQPPLWSANQMETLAWALEVLRWHPCVDSIPGLMQLQEQEWVQRNMDANHLQSVITRQPWATLAAQIIENPTANPAWDAQVLIMAANCADGLNRTVELAQATKLEYYVEGLKRWVLGGAVAPAPQEIGYLEELDELNAERLVAEVTAFANECESSSKRALLARVERSLDATGHLADFFDRMRIRRTKEVASPDG
ncbi:MAG: ATP-binding protein [Cryobacterium sp.]|nr:ATP-binding protein [Cryobacterium sp.]